MFSSAKTNRSLLGSEATGPSPWAKSLSIYVQGKVYELPRAFHTATLLPNKQVLLWGGETYDGGAPTMATSNLVYDVGIDDYGIIGPRTPPVLRRSHHQAAVGPGGRVLIVGGLTQKPAIVPANDVEWFDIDGGQAEFVTGLTLPALDATVMPVKRGELIAVVGGSDGTVMSTGIQFFKFDGAAFVAQPLAMPPRLAQPGRRAAAGALINDGEDLLLLGGYSDVTGIAPLASSETMTAASTIGAGPGFGTARGDICAVTSRDGKVLAFGGRTSESGGAPHSDSSVALVNPATGTNERVADLPRGRYGHTCTALLDGTVLVTGGVDESTSGTLEVLQDAFIYTRTP